MRAQKGGNREGRPRGEGKEREERREMVRSEKKGKEGKVRSRITRKEKREEGT